MINIIATHIITWHCKRLKHLQNLIKSAAYVQIEEKCAVVLPGADILEYEASWTLAKPTRWGAVHPGTTVLLSQRGVVLNCLPSCSEKNYAGTMHARPVEHA